MSIFKTPFSTNNVGGNEKIQLLDSSVGFPVEFRRKTITSAGAIRHDRIQITPLMDGNTVVEHHIHLHKKTIIKSSTPNRVGQEIFKGALSNCTRLPDETIDILGIPLFEENKVNMLLNASKRIPIRSSNLCLVEETKANAFAITCHGCRKRYWETEVSLFDGYYCPSCRQ